MAKKRSVENAEALKRESQPKREGFVTPQQPPIPSLAPLVLRAGDVGDDKGLLKLISKTNRELAERIRSKTLALAPDSIRSTLDLYPTAEKYETDGESLWMDQLLSWRHKCRDILREASERDQILGEIAMEAVISSSEVAACRAYHGDAECLRLASANEALGMLRAIATPPAQLARQLKKERTKAQSLGGQRRSEEYEPVRAKVREYVKRWKAGEFKLPKSYNNRKVGDFDLCVAELLEIHENTVRKIRLKPYPLTK